MSCNFERKEGGSAKKGGLVSKQYQTDTSPKQRN